MKKLISQQNSMPLYIYCILAFIFSPILSIQETADPLILYVLLIIILGSFSILKYYPYKLFTNSFAAYLFLLSALISSFVGYFHINQIIKTFIFVFFYSVISCIEWSKNEIIFVVKAYVGMAIIVALLIILSALFGYSHTDSFYYLNRYSIGITGLYKNPNYLASFINLAQFFVFSRFLLGHQKVIEKLILGTISFLFLIACYLTGTRIALVLAALIFFSVSLFLFKKENRNIIGMLFLFFMVLLILINITFLESSLDFFLGNRDAFSDESRETSWLKALQLIYESPIFGYGLDTWILLHGSEMRYLHNVFLELILNQGFIGLFLFVIILFSSFKLTKKADRYFLILLIFVAGFPLLFQNGIVAVNFWRFMIISRIAINYSSQSQKGILNIVKYE